MFGKSKTNMTMMKAAPLAWLIVAQCIAAAPAFSDPDGCNLAGAPAQTLRTPLIPGAPSAPPGAAPWQGQPPAPGDGPAPAPLIPGDPYPPVPVPTGMADPTHGNIFPPVGSPPEKGPRAYVPGAGRRGTEAGQQQGMFDFGQGNGGQGTFESGAGNGGQGTFESGAGNGGQGTFESGAGNGGQGTFEGGGGNGGQGTFESGAGNGGQGTFEGGGGNGGLVFFDFGQGNSGTQVNGDGRSNGRGVFNNGGPRPDAVPEADRIFANQKQPSKYEFQGPLPTVRTFSRYLVILGVVAATVFVALAGWSVVLGSPYGPSRVIGAVGGLILLLAGYTIWKIVQMNTFDFNSTGWSSRYRDGTTQFAGNSGPRPGANPNPIFSPENPNPGGGAPPAPGGPPAPPGGGPFDGENPGR